MRLTKEERREAIVRAAMEEFAVGGLNGTPVEAIARRVGVSQPYLFQLFGTKKELFIAAIRHGFQRTLRTFMEAAASVPADADAPVVLKAMGLAYRDLLEDRTLLLAQMQAYVACDDPDVREVVRDEYGRIYHFVERASGAPPEAVRAFFAEGMLMNVAAAMDLPALKADWAQACVGWMKEPS
ncbi:MAG: TetR/AcrR family transcriptional regulator [Actinomycetota bacterium]|nr:TetR/AcrR family transcriptional regulator [Actinomycetota bacterium]